MLGQRITVILPFVRLLMPVVLFKNETSFVSHGTSHVRNVGSRFPSPRSPPTTRINVGLCRQCLMQMLLRHDAGISARRASASRTDREDRPLCLFGRLRGSSPLVPGEPHICEDVAEEPRRTSEAGESAESL